MGRILNWVLSIKRKENPDPLRPLEDFFEKEKIALEALRGKSRIRKKAVVVSYNITSVIVSIVVCLFLTAGFLTIYYFFPVSSDHHFESPPLAEPAVELEKSIPTKPSLPVAPVVVRPKAAVQRKADTRPVSVKPSVSVPDKAKQASQNTATAEHQLSAITVADPPPLEAKPEAKETPAKKGLFHRLFKKK